jgi:hypothetical protein
MAVYDAGDAAINVRPSLKGFVTELESELKKIDASIGVSVHPNLAQARADLARWREMEQSNAIDVPVKVDTSSIGRANRELGKLVDTGKLLSAVKWNAGAIGIGSLPAVATALATVAGSLQQVSQAGLAMPGVMATAGASVGTLKLATAGLGDTMKEMWKAAESGDPKDIKKAAEALKDVAPNAKDALTAVTGFHDQFKSLRNTVQNNTFAGVDTSFKDFANKTLPTLNSGLGKTSTAWNATIKEILRVGGLDSSQSFVDRLLGNTADAQTKANKAIAPIAHAIGQLTATSSDAVPRLADGLVKAGERFDAFISKAAADGRLDKWINDGITGVDKLGNTVLNIGKSFTAITQAAGGGDGLLSVLQRGSEKLSTFLNSDAGQEKLKKFFEDGREQIRQWLPLLENLGPILSGVFDAAREATNMWLPMLTTITGWLADSPEAVKLFAEAFIAWKTIDGITSLLGALGTVRTTLLGLPATAGTAAAGISSALASVALPAWLAYLAGQQNDARHPEIGDALKAANNGDPSKIQGLFNDIDREHRGQPTHGNFNLQAPTPAQSREHRGLPPYDPTGGLLTPGAANSSAPPAAPSGPTNALDVLVPHYDAGGPTPSGRGNGPTGGFISELHADEFVANRRGRTVLGDDFLHAANMGVVDIGRLPGYELGGYPDPNSGNAIHSGSGAAPGPAVADPGSPADSAAGGFMSGLDMFGGLFGGARQTSAGADDSQQKRVIPGLWGLAQAGGDPDMMNTWGKQTGEFLGDWTSKLLGGLATNLYTKGLLGFFGLENSILSPSNKWFQAAASTGQFYAGMDGPLGILFANDAASMTGGKKSKAATPKQLREAQDRIADREGSLQDALARQSELKATAKDSQRASAQRAVDRARRELDEAKADLSDLQSPGASGGTTQKAVPASVGGGNKGIVYQAMLAAGYPESEWPPLQNLLNGESGFNSTAKNPSSTAYGMFQFLDTTWATVGGSKTSDPATQAQYGLAYIKQRYGTPSAAWAFWQRQSPHWYATGGDVPGSGRGDTVPAMLTPGEHVFTTSDVAAMGGQKGVYAFRQALHMAVGGEVPAGAAQPRPIIPPLPDVRKLNPGRGATPIPSAPVTPLPAPVAAAPMPAPAPPPVSAGADQGPAPDQQKPTQPAIAGAPSSQSHLLPAAQTAITEGASTLGNIAATAASMGAGAAGGAGGAGAGTLIQGMFNLGGKAVSGAANVFSSALVGNLGDNTTAGAYGAPVLSTPPQPAQPIDNRTMFGDVQVGDPRQFVEEMALYEQQRSQAQEGYVR